MFGQEEIARFYNEKCTNKLKVIFVIQTKLGLLTVGFKKAV